MWVKSTSHWQKYVNDKNDEDDKTAAAATTSEILQVGCLTAKKLSQHI